MDRQTTIEFRIFNRWVDNVRVLLAVVPATDSWSEAWCEVATFPGHASNELIVETLGTALAPLIKEAVSGLPSGRV